MCAVSDKELLHSLKCALRTASKSSPAPSALLLGARYFLFVGKVSRARQCIEKRIKAERDDAHLLALFAWMDLREAAAAAVPEGEEGEGGAEEAERAAMEDRARNVLRKAIRLGTAEMRAESSNSSAAAAAALSRSHTAAAAASLAPRSRDQPSSSSSAASPSLLLAYCGRASQLHSRGETAKARRELDQLAAWFPQCAMTLEWKAMAIAAEGEWKDAMAVCEAALGTLSAAANPVPRCPDLNESDSVSMRWLVVLHALLHAPSLSAPGVGAKIAALMSSLRAIEWRNVILLSRFARTLTALSRGDHGVLDASLSLLDRAMHVHRQAFPSSAHGEMSRLLVLQGQALICKGDAAEALESFLEAFVMDESSAEPTLGQLHALLLLRRFDEAKKLLATLPIAAVRSAAAAGGGIARLSSAEAILADSGAALRTDFRVSYYRALLAWRHGADADAAAGHLVDALDLHMAMMDATGATGHGGAGASSVLDEEYFPRTNPPLLVGMGALYFDMLGAEWASYPPTLDADETHAATLLSPLLAVLSRLGLSVPGRSDLLAMRARLEFIQQDYAGCRCSMKRALALQQEAGSDAAPEQQEQLAQLAALLKRQQASRPQSPAARGAARKDVAGQHEEEKSHPTQATAQPQLFSTHVAHASRPHRLDGGAAVAAAASVAATSLFSSRAAHTAAAPASLPPRSHGQPSAPAAATAAGAPLVVSSALSFDDLVDFDEAESAGSFARRPPSGPPTIVRTQLQREMEEEAREALDMRTSVQREQSNQLSLSFTPSLSPDASLRQLQPMQPRVFVGLRGGGGGGGSGAGHMSRDDSNSSLAAVSRNSSTASLNSTAHAHGQHQHAYLSHISGLASSDSNKSVGHGPSQLFSVSSLAYSQSLGPSPSSTPLSMSRQPSEGVLGVTTAATAVSAASLAYYNASPTAAAPPPSLYTSAAERAHGHGHGQAQVQSLSFTSESSSAASSPVVPAPRSLESARLQQLKAAAAARAAELEAAAHFLQVARHGCTFWKHGRSGQPHERTVKLEVHSATDELRFDWGSDRMVVRRSDARLLLGKQSDVLQRDTARRSKPDLCFTVAGPQRTLDLEARNKEMRQQWVEGITALLHREHADPILKQRSSHDSISGPASSFLGHTHSAPSSVRPSPPSTQR